ncbi:MAG: TraR/DksA family transcriptional regulator [Leptospiraceae bacterium]|nr:TraR/DksA family transcriptional regulator [Leptospiraceae bacterium]MCB1321343.1 TraR/DksA family transcriptional regulator [Leptospiraceae bacterium]
MEKAKLEKYRKRLLETRASIINELEVEKEYFEYNDQGDIVDIADAVISNEILSRLSDLDVEKIEHIEAALEKIDKGTYGICEGTGKKIPESRLNHIPWARYTIEYAEQMEKQRR